MSKQTVFLVGATGETGSSILEALVEYGSFDITCFIRTASAQKATTQKLKDRGLKVVIGNLSEPVEEIARLLRGIDTVICSIFAMDVADQIPLIGAAAQAGVKRFVPCNWAPPCPRGGVMDVRDLREEVHDHIFRHHLGYTIIDVGFWYEATFPRVPGGQFDYAAFTPINELCAGGSAPNMLIAKKDVGRITAEIIRDERTLNKRVYAYGDVLNQNEIHTIIGNKTGQKLELTIKSADDIHADYKAAKKALEADPSDMSNTYKLVWAQYCDTKYVRVDNTPENAEYLGYISARELYPDFKFIPFTDFVDELIAGKVPKSYPHIHTRL